MASDQPDLTLPNRIPEMEQYHNKPMELLPFALYTLCDISDEKLESCRTIGTTDTEDDNVKVPPRAKFPNQPLRSIVNYHIELGKEGRFDHRYFIVCVHVDSWTVLLVTLDDDELECRPDCCWMKMDGAGLALVNLQIANVDWEEMKDGGADGPEFLPPESFKAGE